MTLIPCNTPAISLIVRTSSTTYWSTPVLFSKSSRATGIVNSKLIFTGVLKIIYDIYKLDLEYQYVKYKLICQCLYRIRSNYRTYPYKRTVKKFRSLQITASVIFLYFFLKAYVVGTHLNCIDLSMQFKWVPTTYACIKKIRNNHIIIIK